MTFIMPVAALLLAACTGSHHARMQQELAVLQAMNQANSLLTNDSLAQALADWFDDHGTPNEQMEAHYLLGRTHADRGEAPAALAAYHDAADRADTTAADCDYRQLCRVYAQMAGIFYQQNLLKDNLECLQHYIEYGWRGKDTASAINGYGHKMSTFDRLQMHDSIISIGDYLYEQFYKEKAYKRMASRYFAAVIPSLLHKGMNERARLFIDIYEKESGYFDSLGNIVRGREVFYNCKARYFEAVNRLDSAEYYLRKELTSGKDYINQNMASKYLSRLFLKTNMPDSAAKYAIYSYDMNDSLYAQMATAEVEKAQNMYNYTRHKEQAIHEKERADREQGRFRVLVVLLVIGGAVLFFMVWKKKKEREAERREYEENRRMLVRLQEEKKSLMAVVTNYENLNSELEGSMEIFKANAAKLNEIIGRKSEEIKQLEEKVERYSRSMDAAGDTVETHYKASGLYEALESKVRKGMRMTDEDLTALDIFAKEHMPALCSLLMSNGVDDEKKCRTCFLFRLHLNVKDVSNLLGVTSPYISQISKDMLNSLFSETGSSKELKKKLEYLDKAT